MNSFRAVLDRIIKHKAFAISFLLLAAVSVFFFLRPGKEQKILDRKYFDRIPVSVVPVTKASVRDSFSTVGTVKAFREADIFSESDGIVRTVSAEPGDRKKAGEVLFKLDNELQAALLKKAGAHYRQASRDFNRYKNLHAEGAVSLSSFEAVQLQREEAEADYIAANRKFGDTRLKAPFSGVVTSRNIEEGELVREGTKVAHMLDLSKVKILVDVPEYQIMKFREGSLLAVTSDLYPKERFTGTVSAVSDKAGRDHTFRVEVVMDNPPDTPLRSGMFARVIRAGSAENTALLIPRAALVSGIRNPEVYVVRNGRAYLKRIVTAEEYQQRIVVLRGLSTGELVVVSGQDELQDGMEVIVINRKNGPSVP
ncbi:MAG: efflux RND transporter periplasmic adaptor subunit [Chlorobiaceae bacterium]|nr:efflux RND transporter periplasmic adaptor subunit [Chlorobiaceae bacterium]NTV60581.1 efflux RND transporter periplasmic adaptor subunit [Chlorobiaceae bacterium]